MSTLRQKKLAHNIVENLQADKPLNKQELVASVGYSEMSADKKATEILGSKGVQDELKKLGFDEDTAKEVVGNILTNAHEKSSDRLKAAEMVFKTFSTFAPDRSITLNVNTTASEKVLEAARLLNDSYRT